MVPAGRRGVFRSTWHTSRASAGAEPFTDVTDSQRCRRQRNSRTALGVSGVRLPSRTLALPVDASDRVGVAWWITCRTVPDHSMGKRSDR